MQQETVVDNAFNTRCAIIDMFLLSKCNKLIV